MPSPSLVVRRFPYEEPHRTQISFTVSNGTFSGSTDIYCEVDALAAIGRALQSFPTKRGDEFRYEYGTDDPAENFHRHFILRAYTLDDLGRCALQFTINLNRAEPDEGVCRLSVRADAGMVNRLGELFLAFADLRHLEFHWSPAGGALYESHQEPVQMAVRSWSPPGP